MLKTLKILSVSFLVFALSAGFVFSKANTRKGKKPHRGPCAEDVQKFCASAKPGPELGKCLDANKEKLSAPCKTAHERREAARKACEADVQKFCANEVKGKGNVGRCLMKNRESLSRECQATMPKNRPQKPDKRAKGKAKGKPAETDGAPPDYPPEGGYPSEGDGAPPDYPPENTTPGETDGPPMEPSGGY